MLLMTNVLFAGLRGPVRFLRCPRLFYQAQRFFHDWPSQHCLSDEPPIIHIRAAAHESNGYIITSSCCNTSLREPTITSALCSLSIEMVTSFCEEHQDLFCLHAAAVGTAKGAILLLGNNHAGKSTLVSRLMADGHPCYGDDLIGITAQGNLFSFGLPPRLRLPLPPSEKLVAFARTTPGIRDKRYQYLYPDSSLSVPFGPKALPLHLVFLDRQQSGKAAYSSLMRRDALTYLLPHYLMRKGDAEAAFRHASNLTQMIPASLLQYTDVDEAAFVVQRFFDRSECSHTLPASHAASQITDPEAGIYLPPSDTNVHVSQAYVQAPGVKIFLESGAVFLIDSASNAVYGLNPMGEVLWRMMNHPLSAEEAVSIIYEHFKHIDKNTIIKDVSSIFNILKNKNLIIPYNDRNNT